MNRAKIILFCTLAACGYGIAHDQVTMRICTEYFSVAHPPLFPTRSPTLLALCWGIAATWFIGLAFGVVLAMVAHAGPQAPWSVARFYRPVFMLLAMMGLSAFAAGLAGFALHRNGVLTLPASLDRIIPAEKHARFMAAWFAHLASYLVGLVGGVLVCLRAWRERGSPLTIALLPRNRAAWLRSALIVVAGVVIWWWRSRAP